MNKGLVEKLLVIVKKKFLARKDELGLTEKDYDFMKRELKFIIKSETLVNDIAFYLKEKRFGGTKNIYNSMVFYILGITNKKPDIEKEFNFEYELDRKNTRLSPPDVDIDFEHTEKIIGYLERKYGSEKVALIGTSGTFAAKAAIQFCAKAMNIAKTDYGPDARRFSSENDQAAKALSKIIPNLPSYSLEQWLGEKPIKDNVNQRVQSSMRALYAANQKHPKVFKAAKKLCGLNKNYGTHAAGVILSYRDVSKDIPLFVAKSVDLGELKDIGISEEDIAISNRMSTQFDWRECEEIGLLKFDLLQIDTLRQMSLVEKLVEERHGKKISVEGLKPNDPKVFETIDDLKLEGVFQISGNAFTSWYVEFDKEKMCNKRDERTKRIKLARKKGLMEVIGCSGFNDIVAANALGRPGALAFKLHEKYREAKEDPSSIKYPHPALEPILKNTYGCLIYQEQLIKMSMKLAGFNFSEADKLRKACGKKLLDILTEMESKFRAGCKKNEIPDHVIDQMWNTAVEFGNYAFNAAHSVAYGYIAYQTAWLKTYYPTEFICAVLGAQAQKDEERLEISEEKFFKEYKKLKILPVSVNDSKVNFYPEADFVIRSPLESVKGIGQKAAQEIVKNQPYVSVRDFMARVGATILNSRELQAVIDCGAMDCLGDKDHVANEIKSYQRIASLTTKKQPKNNLTKNLF